MATRQELHLEILNQEYRRFVHDQVLTEGQLNEIIDFFEDQHRLTRTCLIGTGIVCGLHLYRNSKAITLTPGVAVTTDGDLLRPTEKSFVYFRKYTPPDNCHYDPFYFTQNSGEKQVTLFQLLTEEEKKGLNSDDFQPLQELDGVIKNWVALLYLEYYTKDPEKCTPTNCDNLGIRQKATPKVLILSREDMDKIIHKDANETIGDDIYLKYHEAYKEYFTFPVLRARRVILGSANTLKSATLAGAYYAATKSGSSGLVGAIKKLYKTFSFLIDRNRSVSIDSLVKKLATALATSNDPLFAQYTYDFYKDVIAAYNDLRETLYNVANECCPNLYAFPKHIMLGAANIAYGPQPPEYRHQFYPSPAVSKNKVQVNVAIGMLYRLKLLVYNFKPQQVEAVKITPSRDYNQPLADRAIPFYYKNISQLAQEWSYGKALKGQEKLNLSYNAHQYDPPVRDEVLNPLDYDIDPYNFFRVEGHIGKDFRTALKDINELKSSKGVPFDLVAVRLGDVKLSDIDLKDFDCYFEDLNTILKAFQAEINCLLSEGTTFFSGFTADKARPHINLERYIAKPEQQKWPISDEILQAIKIQNLAAETAALWSAAGADSAATMTERIRPRASSISADTVSESMTGSLAGLKPNATLTDFCAPLRRPVFSGARIVKSKLDLNQDTFGKYYLQALEAEPESVTAFMEKSRNLATDANSLKELNEDERFVAFEYPMQIIGNLSYMQRYIPASIGDISDSLITGFRDFSQNFCKRLKAMHTRLESHFKSADYTSRGYETFYMTTLNNLGRLCCANEKLEVILREIEKRKAAILQRLSFTKFAEQHPGLEHKGGVHRGGTFVIVYAGSQDAQAAEKAVRDALNVNGLPGAKAGRIDLVDSRYRDLDAFALHLVANEDTADKETELSSFLTYQNVRPGSAIAEVLIRDLNSRIDAIRQVFCRTLNPPAQDIVFADFCLPYLCCSNCPPVAFIIPRERKVLALPTDKTCTTKAPIPFSAYSPKGAVIASAEAPDSLIAGDNPAFDPAKVPDEQLGKTITFTLDGEPTDCAILVRRPLAVALTAKIQNTDGDTFQVVYANTTVEAPFGANSYAWTFNDGSSEVTQSTAPLVKTFSRKQLQEKGITTVTVTVAVLNDPCGSTTSLSLDVPTPEVDSCKQTVLGFLKESLGKLNAPEFAKRVDSTANADVQEKYKITGTLLEVALKAVAADDQATKSGIIIDTAKVLASIYTADVSSTQGDVPRILEELLRVLLLLMLNLVRCGKEIPAADLKAIINNLNMFMEFREKLRTIYPQLNLQDVLEKGIKEFDSAYTSQEPNLKSRLKAFIEILADFP